jgi:signal transduction histidine kinase
MTAPLQPRFTPEESLFLQRTNQALILASITAIIAALAIAILLARTLIHPLHALTRAAQDMSQGNLVQQVNVRSNDEIGQLARSFNQMSQEVYRVNQLRRQMTVDIAHDLRTPLTVIAGYIESMQEGVLKPTPERLGLIYTEIERLQNLVEDLKILSLADSGELPLHPQQFAPKYLLDRAITPFRHPADQKKVSLHVDSDEKLPRIRVDEARMMQVFSNLISNALRYTSDGGEIVLSASQVGESVKIIIKDTGQGISDADLPHIFERFYRADKSRSTEAGETGLGLAIAKALVEAQGGSIHAESTPGLGTAIWMQFTPAS